MSQCDVHVVMIWPFSSSSPARSSYCFGSKMTEPFELAGAGARIRRLNGRRSAEQSRCRARRRARAAAGSTRRTRSSTSRRRRSTPFGPRDRSMTGVDVMPISGATCRAARGIARRFSPATEQRSLPEHGAGAGVERVDGVVLRRHVHDIVRPVPGNGERGQVERLRVHLAVHGQESDLAEAGHADVDRASGSISVRFWPVRAMSLW